MKSLIISIACAIAFEGGSTRIAECDQRSSVAPPEDDDHDCGWRRKSVELEEKLEALMGQFEALKRQVLGKKSEKMPPMDREVRKKRPADPAETQAERRKNAELRATRVQTEDVPYKVPEAERVCPHCARRDLKPVGEGKESSIWDYVPGYFRRYRHPRERWPGHAGSTS